jgi:hypothetical protein
MLETPQPDPVRGERCGAANPPFPLTLRAIMPHSLIPRTLRLPDTDRPTIVLITGGDSPLDGQRSALRIEQEFGPLVVGWLQRSRPTSAAANRAGFRREMVEFLRGEARAVYWRPSKALGTPGRMVRRCLTTWRNPNPCGVAAERLFNDEVRRWQPTTQLAPIPVDDGNDEVLLAKVKTLNPYFLLSFDGLPCSSTLLTHVRGAVVNRHVGWLPTYPGRYAVQRALFHRDLNGVGATAHLISADGRIGPILRRSQACLLPDDGVETCVLRAAALGTELICESVRQIIDDKTVTVFDSPSGPMEADGAERFDRQSRDAVDRDFAERWLADELKRSRAN